MSPIPSQTPDPWQPRPAGAPRPSLRFEIAAGIHGALMLARGRPEGVLLAAKTGEGAWRACIALVICLPASLAMTFFAWANGGWPAEGVAGGLAREMVRILVTWAGFLLMSERLAFMIGRGVLWPRFVSAWNWSQVPQYLALIVMLILPRQLGLPEVFSETLALVGIGYVIWLEWFATRWALQITGLQAAALVGADFAMTLIVGRILDPVIS